MDGNDVAESQEVTTERKQRAGQTQLVLLASSLVLLTCWLVALSVLRHNLPPKNKP